MVPERRELAKLRFSQLFEEVQRSQKIALKETAEKHSSSGMFYSGNHVKSAIDIHLGSVARLLEGNLEILLDVYFRDRKPSLEEDRAFLLAETEGLFIARESVARKSLEEMFSSHRLPVDFGYIEREASRILSGVRRKIEILIKENRIFFPEMTDKDIAELLTMEESACLEFKSTFQWDIRAGLKNEDLRLETIRTLAAFSNTEGGFLLLGVEDNKDIFGLEKDYSLISRPDRDGFCQLLTQEIENRISRTFVPSLRVSFHKVSDRDVCKIAVNAGNDAVWAKEAKDLFGFYIRTQNSTRKVSPIEAVDYIRKKWPVGPKS